MDQRLVQPPEKVRSARKGVHVRYVLAVSLVLVIIAFIIVYFAAI